MHHPISIVNARLFSNADIYFFWKNEFASLIRFCVKIGDLICNYANSNSGFTNSQTKSTRSRRFLCSFELWLFVYNFSFFQHVYFLPFTVFLCAVALSLRNFVREHHSNCPIQTWRHSLIFFFKESFHNLQWKEVCSLFAFMHLPLLYAWVKDTILNRHFNISGVEKCDIILLN